MIKLRDYQSKAIEEMRSAFKQGKKKVLMVCPTGSGKSWILAKAISLASSGGKRVLLMVHRRNLVLQLKDTLMLFGIEAGVIMAGIEPTFDAHVQLSTVQTFSRRLKLTSLGNFNYEHDPDLVLVDEAHTSVSKRYQEILSHYSGKFLVGCTATPIRSDGRGLGEVYDSLVNVISVKELTDNGFLSPVKYYVPPAGIDLGAVKMQGHDYQVKDLADKCNKPKIVGDVVAHWLKLAGNKSTIVFCIDRKHAKSVSDEFTRQGVANYYLDANSSDEEREDAFIRMEDGRVQVIVNIALYQEGMDCPRIECVVMARPTKSIGLWRQCVGRGLRMFPGKFETIVIDHGGCVEELGQVDEELEWSLDGEVKEWQEKKKKEKPTAKCKCTACHAVFEKMDRCPECGSPVESFGRKVEVVDAELEELNNAGKKATTADKRRYWAMLSYWVKATGKNPKMIVAKYKSFFGVWPRGMDNVPPMVPDQAFLNRMKHDQIKFIKSKEAKK